MPRLDHYNKPLTKNQYRNQTIEWHKNYGTSQDKEGFARELRNDRNHLDTLSVLKILQDWAREGHENYGFGSQSFRDIHPLKKGESNAYPFDFGTASKEESLARLNPKLAKFGLVASPYRHEGKNHQYDMVVLGWK